MRIAAALMFAIITAGCATTPVSAQPAAAPTPTAACIANAGADLDARRACIGAAARACMDQGERWQTTAGMVECVSAERGEWEALRDQHVATLRAQETPSQVALLDAALAEHERWTQARCAYAASIYEGGSLARVVAAQCMRDAVAEFTIELIGRYDEL